MRGLSRGGWLLAFLLAVLFLAHASLFLGEIIDDAYIAFRYAHNLTRGLGLVFNPGERVEGFTSFGWVLFSALSLCLGAAPEITMPLFGAVSGAALVGGTVHAGARLSSELDLRRGTWSAMLLALSPGLAFYAVSGLEQTFYTLVLTCAVLALATRRLRLWALCTSLAFVTRPEAALLGPLGVAILLWDARRRGALDRSLLRTLVPPALVFAACLAPYLGFKLWYFGGLVPNTLHAKTPDALEAARYTLFGSLPTLGLALVAVRALRAGRLSPRERELLGVWFAYVLSVLAVGPDWMPAARFLVPPLPCLLLSVGGELVRLCEAPRKTMSVACAIAACALYAIPAVHGSLSLAESMRGRPFTAAAATRLAHGLVRAGVETVATINIGILGYRAPDIVFIDLAGLVDADIGRGPGGHLAKHPRDAYLLARDPDVFVLTSSRPLVDAQGRGNFVPDNEVEAYVFQRPWFMRRYAFAFGTRVSNVDYYGVFRRRE